MAPAAHGGPRGLEVEAISTRTTLLLFRQKAISAETTASIAAPEITASISVHSHCFGISRQVLLFPSVLEAASTFTASTTTLINSIASDDVAKLVRSVQNPDANGIGSVAGVVCAHVP